MSTLDWLTTLMVSIFIVMFVFILFLDGDTDVEVDTHTDHGSLEEDFLSGFFSVKSLVTFGTFFLIGLQIMLPIASKGVAILVSTGIGFGVTCLTLLLVKWLHSLRDERKPYDPIELVGKFGQVYLSIPVGGMGKVHVSHLGIREFDAVSKGKGPLPTGSTVEIIEIIDSSTLVVQALS